MQTHEIHDEIPRQSSLFDSPVSRIYELQDALEQDQKMVKEKETDYPVEFEVLAEQIKNLNGQLKTMKEDYLKSIKEDEDYIELRHRAARTKIELDNEIAKLKKLVEEETAGGKMIEENIDVHGSVVMFRAYRAERLTAFFDGKELWKS